MNNTKLTHDVTYVVEERVWVYLITARDRVWARGTVTRALPDISFPSDPATIEYEIDVEAKYIGWVSSPIFHWFDIKKMSVLEQLAEV